MNETLLVLLEKLAKIGEDTDARETTRPKRMLNITRDTGRLLWILVRAMGATRILEVGTSNAFSTIWLADAARSTSGRVTTLELNPEKIALARANLATAGLEGLVEIIEGRAADTLSSLPGPFDVVFLDADRPSYLAYLELELDTTCDGQVVFVGALRPGLGVRRSRWNLDDRKGGAEIVARRVVENVKPSEVDRCE